MNLLDSEASRWTKLFRDATGKQANADGPTVDSAGAAALDVATGGLVFGDPVAHAARDDGDDMVAVIGERLELAASQSWPPPVILMNWFARTRSAPPRSALRRSRIGLPIRSGRGRSSRRSTTPSGRSPPGGSGRGSAQPTGVASAKVAPARSTPTASRPAVARRRGTCRGCSASSPVQTPVWRTAFTRTIYMLVVLAILVGTALQIWADTTGYYIVDAMGMGIGVEPWRSIIRILAIAAVLYLLLGLAVGWALKRWARQFDFQRIPHLLMDLDAEACAYAVSDVARCTLRREGARVARAAADTLEQGIASGAATAEAFGKAVDPVDQADDDALLPPYQKPIATPGHTAATDAAGIYRLYHYVAALRRSFASSLVDAIHTQWPRVRGMFWEETASLIATSAAKSLKHRLEDFHERGIWQGDLARQSADELWSDPAIRAGAAAALDFHPDEPIAMLGAPSDRRLLDITEEGAVVLAIPPELEPVMTERIPSVEREVITGEHLETATPRQSSPSSQGCTRTRTAVRSTSKAWKQTTSRSTRIASRPRPAGSGDAAPSRAGNRAALCSGCGSLVDHRKAEVPMKGRPGSRLSTRTRDGIVRDLLIRQDAGPLGESHPETPGGNVLTQAEIAEEWHVATATVNKMAIDLEKVQRRRDRSLRFLLATRSATPGFSHAKAISARPSRDTAVRGRGAAAPAPVARTVDPPRSLRPRPRLEQVEVDPFRGRRRVETGSEFVPASRHRLSVRSRATTVPSSIVAVQPSAEV